MDSKIIKMVNERLNGQETFSTGANNYNLWLDMYRDEPFWIHRGTSTMGLPSSIASELARLTTIEMESEVANDEDLDADYQKVIADARTFTEYGLALGGVILKPYITAKDTVEVDYITPDLFIPIVFDNSGNISHVVFIDEVKEGKFYYRRIEEHDLTGEAYVINNAAFKSKRENDLGSEVPLGELDRWSALTDSATIQSDKPLFGYFRNPQANNLDLTSPLGVSCYSRAVTLIQDADEQYSRILWEYEGAELAIDADISALKNTKELPKGKERLFRYLDIEKKDGELYQVFSPDIRDTSLFNGLNKILMRIEFLCGLAYGTLSDVQVTSKTAEEIRASKQRSYSTVVDIQKSLQEALVDLVDSMIILRNFYLNKALTEPDISFEFDDSIVVDTKSEQAIRMQEVAAGLTKPETYLMWRYGVSEEEAKKMLPGMNEPDEPDDGIE